METACPFRNAAIVDSADGFAVTEFQTEAGCCLDVQHGRSRACIEQKVKRFTPHGRLDLNPEEIARIAEGELISATRAGGK